jgi:hypothetical protein
MQRILYPGLGCRAQGGGAVYYGRAADAPGQFRSVRGRHPRVLRKWEGLTKAMLFLIGP